MLRGRRYKKYVRKNCLNGILETRSYFVWQGRGHRLCARACFCSRSDNSAGKRNWEPPAGREPKAKAQDGPSQLFRPGLFQKTLKPTAVASVASRGARAEGTDSFAGCSSQRSPSGSKSPNGINQRFPKQRFALVAIQEKVPPGTRSRYYGSQGSNSPCWQNGNT